MKQDDQSHRVATKPARAAETRTIEDTEPRTPPETSADTVAAAAPKRAPKKDD